MLKKKTQSNPRTQNTVNIDKMTKLSELKEGETTELEGASENKTVTRTATGFLFKHYETKDKINLVKSSHVPEWGFEIVKEHFTKLLVQRN